MIRHIMTHPIHHQIWQLWGHHLRVRASAHEVPPTKARRNWVSRSQIHQLFTGSMRFHTIKKGEKTWENNRQHATLPRSSKYYNAKKDAFQIFSNHSIISITSRCPRSSQLQVSAKSPGQKFGKLWPGPLDVNEWCTADEMIRGLNVWYSMKNPEMLSRKMDENGTDFRMLHRKKQEQLHSRLPNHHFFCDHLPAWI